MIYFDNNATTPIAPEVLEAMMPFLTASFGNPSSSHDAGREARIAVDRSRENVAVLLGARSAEEIVFTSCGTESDNWAILGSLKNPPEKKHIVTTRVEHEAVRKQIEKLESEGHPVTWLDVDVYGLLDLEQLKTSLNSSTALVSIMMANNETGVIFPTKEIAKIVKERSNAVFHVDGVNAAGKIPIDLKSTEIDLFSISGHKFHGPKGIGALYVREGAKLPSFLTGGGQESGRRAGTEAVHQIAGLGAAADLAADLLPMERVRTLRDGLETAILGSVPSTSLNGTPDSNSRLPNTSNISFENTNGEAILAKLNDVGICVSTGSACNDASHIASAVLRAMNIPYSRAMGAIRFSLGRYNTDEEVDILIAELPKILHSLDNISGVSRDLQIL
jgi:cysteine desulfurase